MPNVTFAFVITIVLLAASVARAATLLPTSLKDGKIMVALTGEIAEGDSDTLKTIVQTANNNGQIVATIRLNSPGGHLFEGVRLAKIVRVGKIATSVIGSAKCASACFIVFAAGNEKYANYGASVGVHGASDQSGKETAASGAATVSMARIVRDFGVPPSIIGKMVVTRPEEMVWLTPDDLRLMGAIMTGTPSQLAPERPFAAKLPPKPLRKESQDPPPNWEELLTNAIELSKQQNGGTADFGRICQPELKKCINGLSFKSPRGTDMIMKVTEDMNGTRLKREVCTFNKDRDVRTCVNWDTGDTHRDVQNQLGEWHTVEEK